jgi:hypothetical protein
MMTPVIWIGVITPSMAIIGAGYAGVVKLTRMAVALESLTVSMRVAADKVDSHEARIAALELRSPGRHARIT